ncbi:hypothetical protein SLE2022_142580 [Rubroshorea leprosula]
MLPQATNKVALALLLMAVVVILVPLRSFVLLVFLEGFTRELPYRRESSDRFFRRLGEWWVRITAAPIQLIKSNDKKRK